MRSAELNWNVARRERLASTFPIPHSAFRTRGGGRGGMIRIIAGEFKGRRLKTPAGDAVRPTGDRVREAWFSILQRPLRGARVLDLFAGSGALGLEALSRGAVSADFVEIHRLAVSSLKVNITLLKVDDRTVVHRVDARSEEHTSELQSQSNLVCRLLLEK